MTSSIVRRFYKKARADHTCQNEQPGVPRIFMRMAFAIFLALVILGAGRPTPFAIGLAAVSIVIVCGHAVLALGFRNAATFLAITLVVSFSIENLGVATGFPFGHYHFEVASAFPHVGAIPIVVGFLYFGMGYPAWIIAGILLDHAGTRPDTRFKAMALPLVASFVMVQWDVVMDPSNATLDRAWIWHDGGGFFGVPLSNFLGWFLTVWLYFQLFALFLHARRRDPAPAARAAGFWLCPILLYLAAGLRLVPPLVTSDQAIVTDASGFVWRAHDIRETAVITMLVTMLATSVLALLRLYTTKLTPPSDAV